jgi:hypothetical protein
MTELLGPGDAPEGQRTPVFGAAIDERNGSGECRAAVFDIGAGHEGRTRDIYPGNGSSAPWLSVYDREITKTKGFPNYRGFHERQRSAIEGRNEHFDGHPGG